MAVIAKTLWGAGPPSAEWGRAIISSRWKNWGPGQTVRGPKPPGPVLEPPLIVLCGCHGTAKSYTCAWYSKSLFCFMHDNFRCIVCTDYTVHSISTPASNYLCCAFHTRCIPTLLNCHHNFSSRFQLTVSSVFVDCSETTRSCSRRYVLDYTVGWRFGYVVTRWPRST